MGSPNNGIARYDHTNNFWLATWSSANWLTSDNIHGIIQMAGHIGILSGDSLHLYNTSIGAFSNTMSLSSLGLPRDGSNLVHWPSMGLRSPSIDQMLVSDGSGRIAVIEPLSTPMQQDDIIIASGPSGYSMNDVIQTGNIVWVAVDEYVDRFDTNSQIWLEPITLPSQAVTLASDSNHVYVGTKEDGVFGLDINNASQIINWNTQTSTGGLKRL